MDVIQDFVEGVGQKVEPMKHKALRKLPIIFLSAGSSMTKKYHMFINYDFLPMIDCCTPIQIDNKK